MGKGIKEKVNNLVNKYNTSNIYELCDYLNINIKRDILGATKGYFLNVKGEFFITLNIDLKEWEEPIVLAHELGHALLHKEMNICFLQTYTYSNTNKYENEANKFAAELLVNDIDLSKFLMEYEYLTLEQASKHFGLPEEFIRYKFDNIEM